ncbi:MAG: glutamine-hydrolyzing carbamoyl-phosphate synthase small subunit, partial [Epsilonproteobacteria bacterium]|nr:glutamine-hydrolyzing carbamoyl-phosphate synthase small subunit [Campylobacterota bacterium]
MKDIWLYFENGFFIKAKSFGAERTAVGEVVFNTSMSGYEEIITDPSYAGQFITFTMPEIGNVGVNEIDMESRGAFCKGVIVRSYQKRYSNYRGEESLDELLKRFNIIGICDIDTRFITKMLREEGAMEMVASTTINNKEQLREILEKSPKIGEINYIKEVSTPKSYIHKHGRYNLKNREYEKVEIKGKIIAYDFGIKRAILNELCEAGFEVEVVPHNFSAKEVIKKFKDGEIKGVFLSNGPGDPMVLEDEKEIIKELINANIPIFAICLGHQMLSIAHGYNTYKLKFGHHGGNHPVKNSSTNLVEITAQNHNYNVPNE